MTKIPDFMVACPDNVYRTKNFIVAQDLQYKDHDVYDNVLLSHDTYYKRTKNATRNMNFSSRIKIISTADEYLPRHTQESISTEF